MKGDINMSNIAILGHPTRGKEVIQLLEMLGGKNEDNMGGSEPRLYYLVGVLNPKILCSYIYNLTNCYEDFIFFTLEEFEEKFPYKVGDIVKCHNIWKGIIESMEWYEGEVLYHVRDYSNNYLASETVEHLQSYKEENMEERKYADLRLDVDQDDKLATEVTIDGNKITPPENYLIGKITKVDNGMLVEFVKKQPQYPKTYEECCEVLWFRLGDNIDNIEGYKSNLLEQLQILLICRDAYWKVYGEQMGLGNPWEPDWKDNSDKYFICYLKDELWMSNVRDCNRFLVFPTEGIRDTFFENFKDLIEQCKELL